MTDTLSLCLSGSYIIPAGATVQPVYKQPLSKIPKLTSYIYSFCVIAPQPGLEVFVSADLCQKLTVDINCLDNTSKFIQ